MAGFEWEVFLVLGVQGLGERRRGEREVCVPGWDAESEAWLDHDDVKSEGVGFGGEGVGRPDFDGDDGEVTVDFGGAANAAVVRGLAMVVGVAVDFDERVDLWCFAAAPGEGETAAGGFEEPTGALDAGSLGSPLEALRLTDSWGGAGFGAGLWISHGILLSVFV